MAPGAELPPQRPLNYHGMNWSAQGLERQDAGWVFRALPGQHGLAALTRYFGYGILIMGGALLFRDPAMAVFVLAIGGLFLAVPRWFSRTGTEGVRVDPERRRLLLPASGRTPARSISFDEIRSVQYLPYRKHASFLVFAELNLVLRDGQRMSLVHHNDLGRMKQDGAALAAVLGVPYAVHSTWRLT